MKRVYIRPVVNGVQVLDPIGWYCVVCGRFVEDLRQPEERGVKHALTSSL